VTSKYGLAANGWDAGDPRRSSFRSPWKFIDSTREEFMHHVELKVGDGTKFKFW